MSRAPHPFPPDSERRFPWEKACYALLAGIGLVLLATWKNDFFEVMSGLMMGVSPSCSPCSSTGFAASNAACHKT